jgi:putative glutamine amidotransferase
MPTARVGVIAARSREDGAYVVPAAYIEGVCEAGARPLVIPYLPVEQIAETIRGVDALLFIGGGDVEPAILGRPGDPGARRIDLLRDAFEFAAWPVALASSKPILGICRGAQCMNIAAGGTLVIDLPRDRPGTDDHDIGMTALAHGIRVTEGTRLSKILGSTTAQVNSAHHQAIGAPAPGFVVSAVADDGVVECIEATHGPFRMGVQWHPEALVAGSPLGGGVFDAFVAAISE